MMLSRRFIRNACLRLVVVLFVARLSAETAPAPGYMPNDPGNLELHNIKAEPVDYQGRKAVRLTTGAQDAAGFAVLQGTPFQDGTIEADVAVKITTPPGV